MKTFPDGAAPVLNGQALAQATARFMTHVYTWMTFGIALTAVVSYEFSTRPDLVLEFMGNPVLLWGSLILQLGAVFFLSAAIHKIPSVVAIVVFGAYAALTGLTFSVLFLAYTQDSITNAFAIAGVSFAGLSAVGFFTKRDLGPIGTFCTMGLFGLIAFSVLALFIPSLNSGPMGQIAALIGIAIFAGLTAWDTQKIKAMGVLGMQDGEEQNKAAILGALRLYLDFINLFLLLLRLFGRRR